MKKSYIISSTSNITNFNLIKGLLSKTLKYSDKTINNLVSALLHYNKDIDLVTNTGLSEEYKQWLVGFVDGDGCFKINKRDNGSRYEFTLVIDLHKDDIKVLEKILTLLGTKKNSIHISKTRNSCSLSIGSLSILKNNILPIFDKYPLLTKKRYDYQIWRECLLMYDKSVNNNNKIEKLKEQINKYDDISLYPTIEDIKPHINLYWLIGFIEAEGSFSIKTQKNGLHFCISQRRESAAVMQSIINYFLALKPDINCPIKDDLKPISNKLYPDNKKVRVFTTTMDFHYWVLIPHLLNYPFQSRKGVDFLLWSILVIMKKHGLFKTDIGLDLLNEIKKCHNSKRYINKDLINVNTLLNMLSITPFYDLNKTHEYNYRNNRGITFKP